MDDEEEYKEDKQDCQDMPALEEDQMGDGQEVEHSVDEKVEGGDDSSVIATPGPPPQPTVSDEEFIAPDHTPAVDPDYEMTEDTDGTDGDDEDEIEGGRRAE